MIKPRGITRDAFACECGCEFNVIDWQLKIELEDVLSHFYNKYPDLDIYIQLTGGNRCKSHNDEVYRLINEERKRLGFKSFDVPNSKHIAGIACDFYVNDVSTEELYRYMVERHRNCYGIGRYSNRIHFDIREDMARW